MRSSHGVTWHSEIPTAATTTDLVIDLGPPWPIDTPEKSLCNRFNKRFVGWETGNWKIWKTRRRPKFFRFWSGRRESNPRPKLGKLLYCHCTTPARFKLLAHSQLSNYTQAPRHDASLFCSGRFRSGRPGI